MAERRRLVGVVVAALLLVLGSAVAACGSVRDDTATDARGTTAASVAPSATAAPTAGTTQPPLVVDPRLLAILPARVAGLAVSAMPDPAGGMIADPSLQAGASAIAVGIAVDPATFDLAVATVVRLRREVYTDGFFEGWRAAYDAAACEPAGGVSGHVRQVLGAHTVDVTVCTEGARTYHVHLAGDIIVSVTAAGDRKLGDLVMAGLRE